MNKTLVLALLTFLTPMAYADQGGFYNSGGSTQVSSGVIINSTVATPSGTWTINCPTTAPARCAGGSFNYVSNDGTMTLSASFTSATFAESCAGGGRGGHVTCGYSFTGYISGTWSVNGAAQAISGVTYQGFGTGGAAAKGTTAYNSAGRIYVMDTGNNRLVRMDDMHGTNWTTMSGIGSGVGQFAQYVAPVAFDGSGGIYVAETGKKEIVRMDDMSGTNWTTLTESPVINTYIYSLQSPIGVAVDAAGRIYIADAEYYQPAVVRVDDMTGASWKSLYLGASSTPQSIAVDSSGMVLVGGGGAKIVDNMMGVLTSSSALTQYYGPSYVFGATLIPLPSPRPSAISFSPATLTFANQDIGTSSNSQPVTITNFGGRPLNFSGISASGDFVETSNCLGSLVAGASCTASVSFAPTVTGPATGLLTLNDDSGNLGASQAVTLAGTGTLPRHLSLSPPTLNFSGYTIGDSPSQTVTVTNTSGASVGIAGIAMSGDPSLVEGNTCGSILSAGATCTVTVTFNPVAYGTFTSTLIVTESSGAQETVSVSGTATPDN